MIAILYFGRLAEAAGTSRVELDPPEHVADTSALRAWLSEANPALADRSVRMALNRDILVEDRPIRPGDEIAFLPAVSGG